MLQKYSWRCSEHTAVWGLAHPLVHGGCSKIGMKTSEAGTCTSQFLSYYWQQPPPTTNLRRQGWKALRKLAAFASLAHDTPFSIFFGSQICSIHGFYCNCCWNFWLGQCLSCALPDPLLLPPSVPICPLTMRTSIQTGPGPGLALMQFWIRGTSWLGVFCLF